jgi:hypothetical protein
MGKRNDGGRAGPSKIDAAIKAVRMAKIWLRWSTMGDRPGSERNKLRAQNSAAIPSGAFISIKAVGRIRASGGKKRMDKAIAATWTTRAKQTC